MLILSSHQTVVVISFSCRCAGGQGTRTLLCPRVTRGRGQRAEPIPNPNSLQRKSEWVLVGWESLTPYQNEDVCGDLGSYGNRWRHITDCLKLQWLTELALQSRKFHRAKVKFTHTKVDTSTRPAVWGLCAHTVLTVSSGTRLKMSVTINTYA